MRALQVVVDAFDPSILITERAIKEFNFHTVREEELHNILMPLRLPVCKFQHSALNFLTSWVDICPTISHSMLVRNTSSPVPGMANVGSRVCLGCGVLRKGRLLGSVRACLCPF